MALQAPASFSTDLEEYVLTKQEEETLINYHKEIFRKNNSKKLLLHDPFDAKITEKMNNYFTEQRINDLLKTANKSKLQKLWHDEQRNKRIEDKFKLLQEQAERGNSKYFFSLMQKFSQGKLVKNSHAMPYIKTLCFFFCGG